MEFTGRIIKVLEQRGGVSARTGNPWKMQDFVIEETIGQFPKRMVFNVFGEENLNRFNIQEGQELTVPLSINIFLFSSIILIFFLLIALLTLSASANE